MKKLFQVILAMAMVVSFLPMAQAGDTAQLGLSVTFDIENQPPYWEIEPQDSTVTAGKQLVIEVLAKDPEGVEVGHGCRWWLNGQEQPKGIFPQGAVWYPKGRYIPGPVYPPVFSPPCLVWDVPTNINLKDVHEFMFVAATLQDANGNPSQEICKKIRVTIEPALLPLKLWSEPEGPFSVVEGQELRFKVIAEDLDATAVRLEAGVLPEGATFVVNQYYAPTNHVEGTFTWTPGIGQAQDAPYLVDFDATSDNEPTGLGMIGKITVKPAEISIEIVNQNGQPVSTWEITGIKLGEKRDNIAGYWYFMPMHNIKNSGDIGVSVDIRYGPMIASGVQPGTSQGLDTFITGLGRVDNHILLEPNGKLEVGSVLPAKTIPLWLTYGAPKGLSPGIESHGATYELRAYGDVAPLEPVM